MEEQESVDTLFRHNSIENLLLAVVLGTESVRQKARQELQYRRNVNINDDFEDSFMTNLSVI